MKKKDKNKKKKKNMAMTLPTTSIAQANKGFLLQNGDVIVEEPEEEDMPE